MDSPLWRFDKYDVSGTLDGATCRISVNGRPLPPDTTMPDPGRDVMIGINDVSGVPLPPAHGMNSISCNGVGLSIVSPVDSFTPPGDYRMTARDEYAARSTSAYLSGQSVTGGLWPLGGTVLVSAYDGRVHLDSMDRHHAWGTFQFLGRRHHGGE